MREGRKAMGEGDAFSRSVNCVKLKAWAQSSQQWGSMAGMADGGFIFVGQRELARSDDEIRH